MPCNLWKMENNSCVDYRKLLLDKKELSFQFFNKFNGIFFFVERDGICDFVENELDKNDLHTYKMLKHIDPFSRQKKIENRN